MNPGHQSIAVTISGMHDVGDCRRQVASLAKAVGCDETVEGRIALVVTELATNLVKHADSGSIIARAVYSGDVAGVEILSLDKGPGMDADACLRDGYSTSGSPGTGLGAIRRLAHSFDLYALPGKGTVISALLWQLPYGKAPPPPDTGAICIPVRGEVLCGDGWSVSHERTRIRMMVSDGLGHGALAAEVSERAIATFEAHADLGPGPLIQALNPVLKPTRGAAIAIADLNLETDVLTFAGIGNIGAYVFNGAKSRGMVSMNGIVGHNLRKVSEFTYGCAAGDMVMLHSDGLSAHWKMEDYPGLAFRATSLIAGTFYRDFHRPKDDATILIVRRQ